MMPMRRGASDVNEPNIALLGREMRLVKPFIEAAEEDIFDVIFVSCDWN